jgi:hypothetical protein
MTVYGSSGELNRNVYHFAELTGLGSTEAVMVHGSHLTFVHRVTGNVTIQDEGSLDGVHWFAIDTEKAHNESGTDGNFYEGRAVQYVRSTVTSVSGSVTVNISVMCH